ncbi:MAG TPA: SusD/RagB family nutrient-binding outer membrane lipoprotein [Chitinophagaceae bacterium]|nr:SusD/RagB family nutrient-binding outer membrane lipoprotein [Chitinophagaceae bacterium]
MKLYNQKKFVTALIACLLISGISCRKILDINHDPNNPSLDVGTPKIVFPVAVMGVAAEEGGDLALIGGILGEYVTQAAAASQYKNIDQYDLKTTDFNAQWTNLYAFGLKNLQFVIDKANAAKDWNFYLMGTVVKAYAAALLVDIYDKIPFSEALQGVNNLTPHFDDGYTVYKALIAEIDTALNKDFSAATAIDLRATNEGNVDLLFGGDIEKWKAFANTLELKLYLRMINSKPAEAQAGIEALYARNAQFLEQDAKVTGFIDAASQSNPLYEQNIRQLNTGGNLVASRTFLTYLQANGDPRAVNFFGANPTGLDQGDFLNTSAAALNASVFKESPTDPVVFLSAAESYFLQAEARERYFSGDGAKALYDQGVMAEFAALGQDASSFIASGGAYEYPSGTMDENMEAILTQKWTSNAYGVHFIEGWLDRNRTGLPKTSPVYSTDPSYIPGEFVVSKNSLLSAGQFPKRLVFPDVEISTNPNTPAQVSITTPVWWGL